LLWKRGVLGQFSLREIKSVKQAGGGIVEKKREVKVSGSSGRLDLPRTTEGRRRDGCEVWYFLGQKNKNAKESTVG